MEKSIGERVAAIAQTLPDRVKLVAVSKYASVSAMREAYAAGIRDFGESKVQEAQKKQQELQDLKDITWHMIGHLQSNKAKAAIQCFDWIHSVDRVSLAQQLDRLVKEIGKSPKICLQVKLAEDPHKSGWYEAELMSDLAVIKECQNLNIVGLMTILPLGLDEVASASTFMQVAELAQKLRDRGFPNLQHLSMGMSGDYPIAVKSGATIVRIGNSVFN
ncbi:YggS family pyridoxal phosphate-dependent enzyme [Pseudanabaena sp. PCC 6802]|uniref:YggS family pyridoxal phosphate-dependent enzyme n=1 Tax=Pseudanabaena sp. PCC 6802 TaxID=118173 RepID=UPI000345A756|nr:YggS family pyridoxal phosphate-dependent enzyme [Pseudanabaena sp. PCC 6802]